MKIGLVDVDNHTKLDKCFPNLPLMKLSAYHKQMGDDVEWVKPYCSYDIVYMSKVFSFTPDYDQVFYANEIIRGGSGYHIHLVDGKEHFDCAHHKNLPDKVEHTYPDYDLYGITDTAYGFMSRGCPRGCSFCHVKDKEGLQSRKTADLSEFFRGQKNIQLMDPNTFACPEWRDIISQLAESGALVDFNQGVDIRLMTDEKIHALMEVRTKAIHFAWDRYEDKPYVLPKLERFAAITGYGRQKVSVYILTNFNTTIEQDIERVETVKRLGFCPYVMRYDKEHLPRGHILNKLARYANTKLICFKCPSFEEYLRTERQWR